MPKDFGKRVPVDPRVVEQISRDGRMLAEQQNSPLLRDWGGPDQYLYWGNRAEADRLTFFAVSDGYSTVQEVSDATGLSETEVSRSLSKLQKDGFLEPGVVEK